MVLSRPAAAQDTEVVTPIQLFDPEAGTGVRVGQQLVLLPRLDVDGIYDTNIYNDDHAKIDDLIASIRPRFLLKSDFARHYAELRGGAEIRRYADTTAENSEQYDISARTDLDLGHRIGLNGEAKFLHGIERRGTAGDQFLTDSPVEFDEVSGALGIQRTGGVVELLAEARIASLDYKDATLNGVPVDLSDRDVTLPKARIRVSNRVSDKTHLYLEVSGNKVRYERDFTPSRDSSGYAALAGIQLQVTSLVDLEAAVGYMHQDFDTPTVKSLNDFNYWLQANWTPRPSWELIANAARTVEPSPRSDVPALVRSDFSLEARHTVSDRLMLTGEGGYDDEKYWGNPRNDRRFYGYVGAHYRLASAVGVIGKVGYRKQDGGAAGRNYEGFAFNIGLRMNL